MATNWKRKKKWQVSSYPFWVRVRNIVNPVWSLRTRSSGICRNYKRKLTRRGACLRSGGTGRSARRSSLWRFALHWLAALRGLRPRRPWRSMERKDVRKRGLRLWGQSRLRQGASKNLRWWASEGNRIRRWIMTLKWRRPWLLAGIVVHARKGLNNKDQTKFPNNLWVNRLNW